MEQARAETRSRLRENYGMVHDFTETPIFLKHLLKKNPNNIGYLSGTTKRAKALWDKLVYDPPIAENRVRARENRAINYKSVFYVLQLPACTKALKIGKGSAYNGDGGVSRLYEYVNTYGNAKILYLHTFEYENIEDHRRQPEAIFEKRLKTKLSSNDVLPTRAHEYYPLNMKDEIIRAVNEVHEEMRTERLNEANRIGEVGRRARNPPRRLIETN
jgi:hypothetical protein